MHGLKCKEKNFLDQLGQGLFDEHVHMLLRTKKLLNFGQKLMIPKFLMKSGFLVSLYAFR